MKSKTSKTKKPVRNDLYGSVNELAEDLGISVVLVYRELNNGTIPSLRVGKWFVISRTAISDWLRDSGRSSASGHGNAAA